MYEEGRVEGHRHVGRCTTGRTNTRAEVERVLTGELGFVLRMPQAEFARGGTDGRMPIRGRLCWTPDYCNPDRTDTGTRFWLRLPGQRPATVEVWPERDPKLDPSPVIPGAVGLVERKPPLQVVTAEAYDARQCPVCEVWVYTAGGPFAENDPTKTLADWLHWEREHATDEQRDAAQAVRFPFFSYNEEPVRAVVEEVPA